MIWSKCWQASRWEILVDLLADGERGLKAQCEFRDDAECAEADDGAFEGSPERVCTVPSAVTISMAMTMLARI